MAPETRDTADEWYTDRLKELGGEWTLVRRLHLRFYRWHIRRLVTGRVLDVGCGIGGNLQFLTTASVGVDHNPTSVDAAREMGLTAFVPEDFHARATEFTGAFDTILSTHVFEHMDRDAGLALLNEYLPYLKPTGRVAVITPQEAGYKTDPTHVRFVDFDAMKDLLETVGLPVRRSFSFPLPRVIGKKRRSNEFVVIAER
jgi:2-polyprenyl-3-methyl-5-hydroxy-6-metoxy-1,4-benzoquinol methylase